MMILFTGGVFAEEAPLTTTQSGTVSGGVHVESHQPVAWSSQSSTPGHKEYTQTYNLPQNTNLANARLYGVVYAAGTDNRKGTTTVSLDGDGDGVFETTLGTESLDISSSADGNVYWKNDHVNKVYSDYMVWYNVQPHITSRTINAKITTDNVDSSNFDGRVKMLTLVAAYNDGDSDQIKYWINQGHDYQPTAGTGHTTNFDTSNINTPYFNANLNVVHLSSKDANYNFNGDAYTGANPVLPVNFFGANNWDVTNSVDAGSPSSLTYTPNGGSFKTTLAVLTVKYLSDLSITGVSYNPGAGNVLFANEPNTTRVTVKNNGLVPSNPFNLNLDIGSYHAVQNVSAIEPGASTNIDFTGYNTASTGPITVSTTIETQQPSNWETSVYYNGYKGKRYTNGSDLNTQTTFEGRLGILYSTGNAMYQSAGWTNYSVNWTSSHLSIPKGSIIKYARLYQAYTWDQTPGGTPIWTLSFNGTNLTPINSYSDRKSYGTYDYPSGLMVYDVTNLFNTAGNNLVITPGTGNNNALYGSYLLLIYQNSSETYKKILINDQCDLLYSGTTRHVTNEEATTYGNFADVNTHNMTKAKLLAILPSAGDVNKSKMFFNGSEYEGFWTGYLTDPQISFKEYDITGAIQNGSNESRYQSFMVSGSGDNMFVANGILITEYIIDSLLDVTNLNGYKGNQTNLLATLYDKNQIPISGMDITFKINGTTVGTAKTNISGIATLPYILNKSSNTYVVDAIYAGNSNFKSSNGDGILRIKKYPTWISVGNLSGFKGSNVHLVANLYKNIGTPLAGKVLTFKVNGVTVGSASTNAAGQAILSYKLNLNSSTYLIEANFAGDAENQSAAEKEGILRVNKTPTWISVGNLSGFKDKNIHLVANLYKNIGTPLAGKVLTFKVNGVTVGKAFTNIRGQATLSYLTKSKPGFYKMQVFFAGDDMYTSSLRNTSLRIR
jgi:hypothetical protein